MRISEMLNGIHDVIAGYEAKVKPIADTAEEQAAIARGSRERDRLEGRAPVGDPLRDAFSLPLVSTTRTLPRLLRYQYITPAASISHGVGLMQKAFLNKSAHAITRSQARLNELVYRNTVLRPTHGGSLLAPRVPSLVRFARNSAMAQLDVLDYENRLAAVKTPTLGGGEELNIEVNLNTGKSVVVFSDERGKVIDQPVKSPTLLTRMQALINF